MAARIRKQVYELSIQDLQDFPVWEFASDEECELGQDEATVRPHLFDGVLDPSDGMFVVAAEFSLADGSRFVGYVTPPRPDDSGLETIQPQIITSDEQVSFWCGLATPNLEANYHKLGRPSGAVFPISFRATVPLISGPLTGLIPGFLQYERDCRTIKTIT